MANFNFNKVILGGRLTVEPELKQTTSGIPVISFSVAVNRRVAKNTEQKADFINCRAWRERAEFIPATSTRAVRFRSWVRSSRTTGPTSREESTAPTRWLWMKSALWTVLPRAAVKAAAISIPTLLLSSRPD